MNSKSRLTICTVLAILQVGGAIASTGLSERYGYPFDAQKFLIWAVLLGLAQICFLSSELIHTKLEDVYRKHDKLISEEERLKKIQKFQKSYGSQPEESKTTVENLSNRIDVLSQTFSSTSDQHRKRIDETQDSITGLKTSLTDRIEMIDLARANSQDRIHKRIDDVEDTIKTLISKSETQRQRLEVNCERFEGVYDRLKELIHELNKKSEGHDERFNTHLEQFSEHVTKIRELKESVEDTNARIDLLIKRVEVVEGLTTQFKIGPNTVGKPFLEDALKSQENFKLWISAKANGLAVTNPAVELPPRECQTIIPEPGYELLKPNDDVIREGDRCWDSVRKEWRDINRICVGARFGLGLFYARKIESTTLPKIGDSFPGEEQYGGLTGTACDDESRIVVEDKIEPEAPPAESRKGWRLFHCEECNAVFWEACRDRHSPSTSNCCTCNSLLAPVSSKPDDSLETDKWGNLKTQVKTIVLGE